MFIYFPKNGYAITLKDLYLNPTIKGWYKILKKSDINKKERKDNIYTHKTIKNAGEFSLTPIQHAYFVGRLNKQTLGGVACQIYQEFDGTPKFTPESLEKALVLLSKRHPMLNIVFHQQGTQFFGLLTQIENMLHIMILVNYQKMSMRKNFYNYGKIKPSGTKC